MVHEQGGDHAGGRQHDRFGGQRLADQREHVELRDLGSLFLHGFPNGLGQRLLLLFQPLDRQDAQELAIGARFEIIRVSAAQFLDSLLNGLLGRIAVLGLQRGHLHAVSFLLVGGDDFELEDLRRFLHDGRIPLRNPVFGGFNLVFLFVAELPVGDHLHGGIGQHLGEGGHDAGKEAGEDRYKSFHLSNLSICQCSGKGTAIF